MWRQWRLINDIPAFGAQNMAADEAILRAVASGQQPPTLRLYAWTPPCLSIGYGQRAREVDWEALAALGWDGVRRMTGGRAILHTDELTYSLCLPQDHPLAAGDVVESYREISRALLAALELLGASPQAQPLGSSEKSVDPVCFETPSHYEITVGGRKLVGSAQARRGGGVLQHGTLPLTGDITRICDGLVYEDEAARAAAKAHVHRRALTLHEALGHEVSWERAADALIKGFQQIFGVSFVPGTLSQMEGEDMDRLRLDTYGQDSWTFRRL